MDDTGNGQAADHRERPGERGDAAAAAPDTVTGADGRPRCGWAGATPIYRAYHDDEWGVPQHDEVRLFEKLCLEAFQSGLSWLTILRKREAFRAAFAGFVPERVAAFGPADVQRLLADRGIVRNRAKVEAAIANARAALELPDGLSPLLWSFAPDPATRPRPRSFADVPATTPESTAMARELRRRGFRFVGPTTAYALMQACGLVDDHLAGCWRAEPVGTVSRRGSEHRRERSDRGSGPRPQRGALSLGPAERSRR